MDMQIIKEIYYKVQKEEFNAPHIISKKNFPCGDTINLFCIFKNNVVQKISFSGESCMLCTASASVMIQLVYNKSVEEIVELCSELQQVLLGNKHSRHSSLNIFFRIFNSRRAECVILPWKAIIELLYSI